MVDKKAFHRLKSCKQIDLVGKAVPLYILEARLHFLWSRVSFIFLQNTNMKESVCMKEALLKASGVLLLTLLWEIGPRLHWVDAQFLPPFSEVIMTLGHLLMEGNLLTHTLVSLWRALTGLLLAAVFAVPLGFVIGGWFPQSIPYLNPLFRIWSQVNPFSLLPVFILFFGIGEQAKLVVVAWICFWPLFYNTITGVQNLDSVLVKTAHSMGVSPYQLFSKVLLPGAMPQIFTGFRLGAELAFFMLIAAEMVGAHAGLGWMLHNAAMLNLVPRIYASGLLIVLLGVFVHQVLLTLERGLLTWQDNYQPVDTGVAVVAPPRGRQQLYLLAVSLIVLWGVGAWQVDCVNTHGLKHQEPSHNMMNME